MRWSFQIGTIKGIEIRVHLTFFLIIIWGSFNYGGGNGLGGLIYGAILTLMVFGIVLLHELGHSLAAMRYGIEVRDITLLPIGGLARLARMPKQPIKEFVVAIAGPAVNMVLAVVFFVILWILTGGDFDSLFRLRFSDPTPVSMFRFLFLVNSSLLIFNLIPAFPLDGGRVFRALLAMWLGTPNATRIAVWVGQGLAMLLGLFGILSGNWMTAFIALFIFTAGGAEGRAVMAKGVLERVSVRQVISRVDMVLRPTFTLTEVASMTLHSPHLNFPVMLGDTLIGVVHRRDVYNAFEHENKWMTVAEIMRRNVPKLEMDSSLMNAQDQLVQADSPVAAVFEASRFQGLIGFEDIERAFQMFNSDNNKKKSSHLI